MEGPLAVRDARPDDISGHRRAALPDHTRSIWLLLVRAQGKAGLTQRRAGHRSRSPHACRSCGLDARDPDPHQGRVRARRAAAVPRALALVPGTLRTCDIGPGECRRAALVRAALSPLAGAVRCKTAWR